MKAQQTNQTRIDSIARDAALFIIENVQAGLTIDEACQAQVEGAMEDGFDEDQYDAPYDPDQLLTAYKEAVVAKLAE